MMPASHMKPRDRTRGRVASVFSSPPTYVAELVTRTLTPCELVDC